MVARVSMSPRQRRDNAIAELLSSEADYVRDLKVGSAAAWVLLVCLLQNEGERQREAPERDRERSVLFFSSVYLLAAVHHVGERFCVGRCPPRAAVARQTRALRHAFLAARLSPTAQLCVGLCSPRPCCFCFVCCCLFPSAWSFLVFFLSRVRELLPVFHPHSSSIVCYVCIGLLGLQHRWLFIHIPHSFLTLAFLDILQT